MQHIAQFFLFLHKELRFSVPVIKDYSAAPNNALVLADMDLGANRVINRMLSSFKRNCLHREIKQSEWF